MTRCPSRLAEPRACFVTLKTAGTLRGCIGHLWPRVPLAQAVFDSARKAAQEDPRFAPIEPEELREMTIEISVLSVPMPLEFGSTDQLLARLRPHLDGVVLDIGPYRATYLPQVWEQLPDPVQFLNSLAVKAGCRARDWRGPDARVSVYDVERVADDGP
jgi:AmmeMemoRadiSam system protein A